MNLGFGFNLDLSNAKPTGDWEPLPADWYAAVLTEFDMKPHSNGVGANVVFKVVEGPHANRQIRDYMTLTHNTSQQANDIGQGRLRSWCDAVGIPPNLSSAEPLLGKTVLMKVKVEKGRDYQDRNTGQMRQGREQNRIETFKAYGPVPSAAAAPSPQAYAPQQYAAPQQQYVQPAAAPPAAQPAYVPPQQQAQPAARGPMPWSR